MSALRRLKRRILASFPSLAQALVREKERFRSSRQGSGYLARVFSEIYRGNLWGSAESASGQGSTLAETATLRDALPALLAELRVKTLVDAPCGDGHWMRETVLGLDRYIGVDIVPELIELNRARSPAAAGPVREFHVADLTRDPLPVGDAILCRDCLIHFSFHFVHQALRNFRRSGAAYLLTTNYEGLSENEEILSGQWRPIDLRLPPFDLPEPQHFILEKEYGELGRKLRRGIGVWPLRDI